MRRIEPLELDAATSKAKELLDEYRSRGGDAGPMVRTMAQAPVVLRGYMDLSRAAKRSHLDRRIIERINLAVHEWLRCAYCLDAHTRAARKLGLAEQEIQLARKGTSADPEIAALVAYGRQLIAAPADVSDAQIAQLRGYGYSDEQIAEVVALVALQQLSGAFNLVAGIDPTVRGDRQPQRHSP